MRVIQKPSVAARQDKRQQKPFRAVLHMPHLRFSMCIAQPPRSLSLSLGHPIPLRHVHPAKPPRNLEDLKRPKLRRPLIYAGSHEKAFSKWIFRSDADN
jgi:hypothetical protein